MLRRKLLLNFGPLILVLVATAVVAIVLLQGVLRDLHHINDEAWVLVEDVNELSISINAVEIDLYELRVGRENHLDKLLDSMLINDAIVDRLSQHYVMQGEAAELFGKIKARIPGFKRHVSALATAQNPEMAESHNDAALTTALQLRRDTLPLSRLARDHAHREQRELVGWFRGLVMALGLVFLLEVNVGVIVILRMAAAVLEPIDKLLLATRELSAGHYDYRVKLNQDDEFDELARAYNALAENLEASEERKMEVLHQVALAMNHELNNAAAIIHVQLQRLGKEAGGNPALEARLLQIQTSLQRMTQSVQSLSNVRRIVLTDYIPGTKMLDLMKSAAP